ncbi:MAG: tRNA guanosine(34) transglycosylase Tgt [Acidobacteriota bacterium]|nr:tRNA guanosine(34) transglycosylase Tgt [Blastocatellia bacterium]MDW8238977.1 tRNA guanosine(34) transglycosylase Tgt [Acidobacteriota bacterium]
MSRDSSRPFGFEVIATDATSRARLALLHTAHGSIETPVFMPVGTGGTVKSQTQEMLEQLDARIILANAYHLYLRPGHEVIEQMGGLHQFISWDRAILTDSGGFQIYSLAPLRKVSEEGVQFQSHLDGSWHLLMPETAMDIQIALGSDVAMVLDECVRNPSPYAVAEQAVALTTRWARRCRQRFDERDAARRQALFGIIQGSTFVDLRQRSLEALVEIGFDGYAIGGLSVGEGKQEMYDTVEATTASMPESAPRYLMGVGTPLDILECVARGVDMFDCVMPTRHARNGQVFTTDGPVNIKNATWARNPNPIDARCQCFVCRRYSRAYLRHLYMSNEMLSAILCTHHNLYFYLDTISKMRHAIALKKFAEFYAEFTGRYQANSNNPT